MAPLGLVMADGKAPSKITVVFNHTFNVVGVMYTFILYHVLLLTGLVFDEAMLIPLKTTSHPWLSVPFGLVPIFKTLFTQEPDCSIMPKL